MTTMMIDGLTVIILLFVGMAIAMGCFGWLVGVWLGELINDRRGYRDA